MLTFMTTASSHMHAKQNTEEDGMQAESSDSAVESMKLPQELFLVTEDEPLWEAQSTTKKYYIGLVAKGEHYCHKMKK